jgi:hypothetical protein
MRRLTLTTLVTLALTAAPALGQPVFAYSNSTTNTGFVLQVTGSQMQGANGITALIADDIHVDPETIGGSINQIEFALRNLSGATWTVRPRVRFYLSDGTGGGPGTLIPGQVYDLAPVTVPAGTQSIVTMTATGFIVPAAVTNGANFWAGYSFDNNDGTTGATLANLDSIGRPMYNPPTVGSSQDLAFITSGVGDFATNNPPGTLFSSGSIPYNFRWAFQVQPVPEPTALALVGVTGLIVGTCRRFNKARASLYFRN